jgi:ketosteroid isomerase-like protein
MPSPPSRGESEQLTRLRAAFELWNKGDYEGVLAYAHPDVVWRISPFLPDVESVYEGHDGLRRFFRTFTEAWEENWFTIERVIDERPGQILVELKFIGKARDGLEVDQTFHQIYRYDSDNMLVEFHGFIDEDEARREAGLTDG